MTTKKTTGKKKDTNVKKTDNLKKENEKLKQEIKEKEDKLMRSYADLQNFQKRMEKELLLKEEETKKKYISELLDLNELLKKAIEDNNPKEGLKLMINNIENFFEKEQIKSINCVGEKFDHNLHHAVTTIEKDDYEDNTIIEEVKKGYKINDKLLRPSQVIVAKKKNND
jgi:molecular chaperone GrpE